MGVSQQGQAIIVNDDALRVRLPTEAAPIFSVGGGIFI
jgi:hypothetical protein